MTQKEELRILRSLLWKISNAQIRAITRVEDNNGDMLREILSEIRYGYCYNQSNSYEGQPAGEPERLRIKSLKRLDKI